MNMRISLMYKEHFRILFFTGTLRGKWQKGRIPLIVMRKINKHLAFRRNTTEQE